ncbi:MAG: hypothetical protein ACRCYP_03345 [Alphaproteobacteria bacterium]
MHDYDVANFAISSVLSARALGSMYDPVNSKNWVGAVLFGIPFFLVNAILQGLIWQFHFLLLPYIVIGVPAIASSIYLFFYFFKNEYISVNNPLNAIIAGLIYFPLIGLMVSLGQFLFVLLVFLVFYNFAMVPRRGF